MAASDRDLAPATAKGEATRAFLLRTAAAVFAERGYTGTTMTDLIAASGLTKGAFYFHFRSKSALALAVLHHLQQESLTKARDVVLASDGAADQLRALVVSALDPAPVDPSRAWTVFDLARELAAEPTITEDTLIPTAEWLDFVTDIVRRGQTDGGLRREPAAEDVAAVVVASLYGLYFLTGIGQPDGASSTRTKALVNILERALSADPAP